MDMIKNICKNIIRDVVRHVSTIIIAVMCIFPSCNDYLDVVPDKSKTMESIFSIRDEAYAALAKAYGYLPADGKTTYSTWLLGDEWVNDLYGNTHEEWWLPIRIMQGQGRQTATNPILGTWSGTNGGNKLYEGINVCNIFISKIDEVKDMDASEKADWKAQVVFLKAYYHFLLLQKYGPVVIMDKIVSPDDEPSSLYVSRNKIDDCFDYIVRTIDGAIPNLKTRRDDSDLGQIDKLGATAIKARVLLYRASPFYSGNGDYVDFYDHDGKPFFPQDDAATTKAKWNDAVKAINEAITLCETNQVAMFTYTKKKALDDADAAEANADNMNTLYNLRMVICDPWNSELIWGNSNVNPTNSDMFSDANIMLPASFTGKIVTSPSYCKNELAATYKTIERYYTKNGLPLDEDNTFDRSTMHELTRTPDTAKTKEYLGFLQSNVETIKLYLNREPRFYANLGITGGYWRSHGECIPTTFYNNGNGGKLNNLNTNYFWTAIGAQKVVHIDNKSGDPRRIQPYPIPIIRLADLYLMKAEALNEYNAGPTPEVYAAINKVRKRAGIPDVEVSYTSAFAKTPGRHTNYKGMKEIIAEERKVEFAFEGHIFWDMIRTKKAPDEFSSPVLGWDCLSTEGAEFFKRLIPLQARLFSLRDNLWPIDTNELNKNSNLIQNPGW
jgi:hypothetical protein